MNFKHKLLKGHACCNWESLTSIYAITKEIVSELIHNMYCNLQFDFKPNPFNSSLFGHHWKIVAKPDVSILQDINSIITVKWCSLSKVALCQKVAASTTNKYLCIFIEILVIENKHFLIMSSKNVYSNY